MPSAPGTNNLAYEYPYDRSCFLRPCLFSLCVHEWINGSSRTADGLIDSTYGQQYHRTRIDFRSSMQSSILVSYSEIMFKLRIWSVLNISRACTTYLQFVLTVPTLSSVELWITFRFALDNNATVMFATPPWTYMDHHSHDKATGSSKRLHFCSVCLLNVVIASDYCFHRQSLLLFM